MDTRRIDRILSTNRVTRKFYQGCFASNLIPSCKRFPCALIVNLDPANEPGSHWCAIFARNRYLAYYFDSYGDKPNYNLKLYLNKNFKKVIQNRHPFQSIFSSVCGHYTIFVIHHLCMGWQFSQILKLLDCLPNSDYTVFQYINHVD